MNEVEIRFFPPIFCTDKLAKAAQSESAVFHAVGLYLTFDAWYADNVLTTLAQSVAANTSVKVSKVIFDIEAELDCVNNGQDAVYEEAVIMDAYFILEEPFPVSRRKEVVDSLRKEVTEFISNYLVGDGRPKNPLYADYVEAKQQS